MPEHTHTPVTSAQFTGFSRPESNFFRMPNEWIDITADIDNIAELKIVQYILRHTWGYQEYGIKKHITIDEFIRGRKRKDGSRMDTGTGLSEMSVRNGIAKALDHGFIEAMVDDSDKARVKKYYSLTMQKDEPYEQDAFEEVQTLESGVQTLDPRGTSFRPRSEKETSERNLYIRNSKSKLQRNRSNGKQGYQHFQAIGDLLKQKTEQQSGGVQHLPEPMEASIDEISTEFNDAGNRRSNRTHVLHVYQASGKSEERFLSWMYEARSITKQQGSVKKTMPYFFRVLADITGVQKRVGDTLPDTSTAPQDDLQQKFVSETGNSPYPLPNRNLMRQAGD
jgi:DNA-binding PadR family transcriptional regulator